jgi:hypothetical protein
MLIWCSAVSMSHPGGLPAEVLDGLLMGSTGMRVPRAR